MSFLDNPIEITIPEFRCFIAQELPRLKYLDWLPITKEERAKAAKLDADGFWSSKDLPVKDTGSPHAREAAAFLGNVITRHSVSYSNKEHEHALPSLSPTRITPQPPQLPTQPAAQAPAPSQPQAQSHPPLHREGSSSSSLRPALTRENSQFNGDFSALGTCLCFSREYVGC